MLEEYRYLRDPETTDHLYNCKSRYVRDMPDELRAYCLENDENTVKIAAGPNHLEVRKDRRDEGVQTRAQAKMHEVYEDWGMHGRGANRHILWQTCLAVKIPPNYEI